MRLGDRIRRARQQKGLTQAQLASSVGISTRSIQGYELNKSVPRSYELYLKLAQALDVAPEYLCDMKLKHENSNSYSESIKRYGSPARAQAAEILEQAAQLFAGGELSDEDKMAFMRDMNGIFFNTNAASEPYTPTFSLAK